MPPGVEFCTRWMFPYSLQQLHPLLLNRGLHVKLWIDTAKGKWDRTFPGKMSYYMTIQSRKKLKKKKWCTEVVDY